MTTNSIDPTGATQTVAPSNPNMNAGGAGSIEDTVTPTQSVEGESILGSVDDDTLNGTAGDDTISSFDGDDLIRAGAGSDEVVAGQGDDTVFGAGGDDTLRGEAGDDVIDGGAGNDSISAGVGADTVFGGAGADFLRGRQGDDFIEGGAGADRIDGGNGDDTASFEGSGAAVMVSLSQGETPQSGGAAEGDVLIDIENVVGSAFDDQITGDNGANRLQGGAGDDTLVGRAGADTVEGGEGDDLIIAGDADGRIFDGGEGADTLRIISNDNLRDDTLISIEHLEVQAIESRNARVVLDASQTMDLETITFNSVNDRAVTVEIRADGDGDINLSGVALAGFDAERDAFELIGGGAANTITGTEIRDVVSGGDGGDVIRTGAGNDEVVAGQGDDTVFGGAGDDILRGEAGDDVINGGAGNDSVRGGVGADTVFGGAGDDFLRGRQGNDFIEGGAGADRIDGGNGDDTASFEGSGAAVMVSLSQGETPQSGGAAEGDVLIDIENVLGSAFDDQITGDNGANRLQGGAGDDTLDGRAGADTVDGGEGDDLIIAGDADGRVFDGGEGADTLRVLSNDDLRDDTLVSIEHLEIQAIAGRSALVRLDEAQAQGLETITFNAVDERLATIEITGVDDVLLNLSDIALGGFEDGRIRFEFQGLNSQDKFTGSTISDRIFGNGGDDELRAGAGDDTVSAGSGDDFVNSEDGDDFVDAGDGADRVFGGVGDDILLGGRGDDFLVGGAGADLIDGGNGDDTASFTTSRAAVDISLDGGRPLQSGGDAAGDVLIDIENLVGSDFDDTITGDNGANILQGEAGNDVVRTLGGRDTVEGGEGNDLIITGNAAGRVFDGGEGADTLRIISNDSLRDDTLTSIEHLEIEGVASRNSIVQLTGDQAATLETITFDPQNGRSATVEVHAEDSTVVDASTIVLTGFDDADSFRFIGDGDGETFIGTAFGDVIEAGAGDDVLVGGAGADTLNGGGGVDRVDFSASGEGVDIALNDNSRRGDGGDAAGDRLFSIEDATGSAFADAIRGSSVANRLDGGAGDDRLIGLGGNDRLNGGDGDDALNGGNGRDRLDGGAGDDVLIGGGQSDTFRFANLDGFGDDVIRDFQQGEVIELLREADVDGFADLDIAQVDVALDGGGTRTDTVITLDRGSITLEDVNFELQQSNFDFFG